MAAHGVKLPPVRALPVTRRVLIERQFTSALRKSPAARMRFAAALATPPRGVSANRYKSVLATCARAVRRTKPGYLP